MSYQLPTGIHPYAPLSRETYSDLIYRAERLRVTGLALHSLVAFWVSSVPDNKIYDWINCLLKRHWFLSELFLFYFKGNHEACDPWWLWPGKRVGCQIHPQPYYPVQAQCRAILHSRSAHRYVRGKWKNALSLKCDFTKLLCLDITS